MKLADQIKNYRINAGLSQDDLADKVMVSRQSISNWENGKTYPDINSLLILCEVFDVTLDQLVKGDIETMKQVIDQRELTQFERDSIIMTVMMFVTLFSPIILAELFGWWGMAIFLVPAAVTLYYAVRIEKFKKKHDIQTYAEIVAFTEGKTLSEIEKARESGKRPYQKILFAIGAAAAAVLISGIIGVIISALIKY